VQIKNFNTYNQKSYLDQNIELPFDIGHNKNASATFADDLSSQKSESSRGAQSAASSPFDAKNRQA
jgi:hypothetical protein